MGFLGASWRTSLAGICLIMGAIGTAGYAFLDGDTATSADWKSVGGAFIAGWALIQAKDKTVTGGTVANDKQ